MRVLPAIVVLAALAFPVSAYAAQRRVPYATLFTGQLNVTPPQPPVSAPVPPTPPLVPLTPKPPDPLLKQAVICGMTVAQGDATIDPKMPHHPPANAPKPSTKIIPAPACQR
jgi:hypothetical protein